MLISKLLVTPFSLVFAGVLKASTVLPRVDHNESTGLVKEGLPPTVAAPRDGREKTTSAPLEASLVPTPALPVPVTPLPTIGIPTTTPPEPTVTITLVFSTTSLTSSSPSATLSTSFTVTSPSSSTLSKYSLGFTTSLESSLTVTTPLTSDSYTTTTTAPSTPLSTTYCPNNNMSQGSSQNGGANDRTLIITLSTVLSVVGAVIIAVSLYLCLRNRRRRAKIFNRGVTPIGDDEIASWKVNRAVDEKGRDRFTSRNSTASNHTHRKVPSNSVIQYQVRPSIDTIPQSPRSFRKQSLEAPQTPQTAVLARAPNARSGLTDETVPGAEPFVAVPKRHPSKLYKAPPNAPPMTHRTRASRGSRSSSVRSFGDGWYGENMTVSPRTSNDFHSANRVPSRVYSTSTAPPRLSFGENGPFVALNDSEPLTTVLSPPPLHRTEIGRAIG